MSEPVKDGQASGARILANLEGRVDPSVDRKGAKRSRTVPVIVAALVIAAGAAGAYRMQQHAGKTEAPKVVSAGVAAASPSVAAASGVVESAKAASAPTPATIVADDDASKDAQHVQAASDDGSRLSRALASGAGTSSDGHASEPVAVANSKQSGTGSKSLHDQRDGHDKHDKRQLADERHSKERKTAVASSEKKHNVKPARKDDSDADLLAALVARTKPAKSLPATANDPQAASKKAGNPAATLAERVSECGQHSFFEEQLCRWRVCDGHWGKDPHCPVASAQARQP